MDNEFGVYQALKDGILVPYPSRVDGTEMWGKARENTGAAVKAALGMTTTGNGKGRGRGRGPNKRKPQDQPEDQPTPKRSARNGGPRLYDDGPMIAPKPAKGLLASAAIAEEEREASPEESNPASPDGQTNGDEPGTKSKAELPARLRSPPPPKSATEADEYGARLYSQRPSLRAAGINSRIFAPRLFDFEDYEIGFKDSHNDSSKGCTRNKRGKYLDNPNSNALHVDQWANGYDYSTMTKEDLDQEVVQKHNLHPKYGIFLPNSVNEAEPANPYFMPGKPVVFIANPSGRTSHASRSFQQTNIARAIEDLPWRGKIGGSFRRFCKLEGVDTEEVSVADYVPSLEELKERSLGTAVIDEEARTEEGPSESDAEEELATEEPMAQNDTGMSGLSVLTYASAFVEAEQRPSAPATTPKPPARYDAIRDVFTDSQPSPAPRRPETNPTELKLSFLAELCNMETRPPQDSSVETQHVAPYGGSHNERSYAREDYAPPVIESDVRTNIKPEREPSSHPFDRSAVPPRVEHAEPAPSYNHEYSHSYGHGHGHPPSYHHGPPATPSQAGSSIRGASVEHHYAPPPKQSSQQPGPYPEYQHHPVPPPTHQHDPHSGYYHQPYAPDPRDHRDPRDQRDYRDHRDHREHRDPRDPRNPRDPREHSREPPRDAYSARSVDYEYLTRPSSEYNNPPESYQRGSYWAPPAHGSQGQHYQAPPPPGPMQQYPPPSLTPSQSRMPFSAAASAEPLPPLRPPRSRTQSIQEDSGYESSLRNAPPPPPQQGNSSSYFPPQAQPPHGYHPGYAEQHGSMQAPGGDRGMPGPPHHMQTYSTSPQPSYAQPLMSPTFINHGPMPGQGGNSPPTTPGGPPGSAHRHRSTLSGSSDAGSKGFRKLQPAPVPAHRASWANKPELRTIPYDHKETGSSAALPSSGPTQIRGWNVNQHKKRGKLERGESGPDQNDPR